MRSLNLIWGLTHLATAVVCCLLARPMIRGKIPMNALYGARFAKSYESEENWQAINRYGGRRMVFWSWILGAIGVATLFVPLSRVPVILIVAMAPMVYLIACIETYRFSRRL